MTHSEQTPFEFPDHSSDYRFDPTHESLLRSQNGLENPTHDGFDYISGCVHPSLDDIQSLVQPPEVGSLILPSTIPLLRFGEPLSRAAEYGVDLVIQDRDRCKHIMVIGPTGAGKNVLCLDMLRYSALLDSEQTVITFSLKAADYGPVAEICRMTGRPLYVINLADPSRSVPWNPLQTRDPNLAYDRIRRYSDATRNPHSHDSDFWPQCVKLAMFGAWQGGYQNLAAIYDLFNLPVPQLIKTLRAIKNEAAVNTAEFIAGDSYNAQTVLASIRGALESLSAENVRRVMGGRGVELDRILRTPVCVHVEMPETSLETLAVHYHLLAHLIIDTLIDNAEGDSRSARASLFADDLPSLGRILTPNRLMTLRSRGIGICGGVQSFASLQSLYGNSDSRCLMDNFHTKVVLPGGSIEDAETFARYTGEQLVGLPGKRKHTVRARPVLSSSEIRSPSYQHPILGHPCTILFGAISVQAYLQRSFEHPALGPIMMKARKVSGRERLRRRRLPLPKRRRVMLNETGPPQFTDTTGWPESRIRAALEKTLKKIESDNTTVVARSWWKAFEDENRDRLGLVLRLAEELETRKATINDLFRCHLDSGTDNIQATLFYLDYQRLKKSHEQGKQDAAKASRPESNAECVDEADEAFIRCPDCQSLIPLNGGRCQMCENQWP